MLYKYTSSRHAESILSQGNFAFPKYNQLNDPLESSIEFKEKSIKENTMEIRNDYKDIHPLQRNPVIRPPGRLFLEPLINFGYDSHNDDIIEHNKRASEHNQRIDDHNKSIESQNKEINKAIKSIIILRKKTGILSLTKSCKNAVMWAHYGDNHKGICIGLDSNHSAFHDYTSSEIIYNDLQHLFTPHDISYENLYFKGISKAAVASEYIKHTFFTKAPVWSYEEEVRIIRPITDAHQESPVPIISFAKNIIREVILGSNIDKNKEKEIKSILHNMPWVKLYKIKIPTHGYDLEVVPIV